MCGGVSGGVVLIASTGVGSNNLKIGAPLPGQEPGLLEWRKLAEHVCMVRVEEAS